MQSATRNSKKNPRKNVKNKIGLAFLRGVGIMWGVFFIYVRWATTVS